MKIIGLIAEYNPFHNGHLYQLNKIKELYPDSLIILITNKTFTQRGDISIINIYDKTKLCLNYNIDLVIELPFAYATQSGDFFAKGAIEILNHLKIDTLVFGSESNNLEQLKKIAITQLNNKEYQQKVKEYLNNGNNYPTALSKALKDILGFTTNNPNDLLGISYIKEIEKNNYPITPITIKRIGNYHETNPNQDIISASLIRNLLQENINISHYIPKEEKKYLTNISNELLFPYLKYKIISEQDLAIYQTVDEGLENKLKKEINNTNSWNELINRIKTKRYTYNKLNRMLIHILTSFTKEEANNLKIDYIKLIGFTIKGKKYLNTIKKEISIPIITKYKNNTSKLLDIEYRSTLIYNLINKKQIDDNKSKPIIK